MYWFALPFPLNLGMSFYSSVEVTSVGETLKIYQFYLSNSEAL